MLISTILNLPRFHVLRITVAPRSNKIKIESELFNQSIIIPPDNAPGSEIPKIETAIKWCEANGYPIIGFENSGSHGYIVTSYSQPLHA